MRKLFNILCLFLSFLITLSSCGHRNLNNQQLGKLSDTLANQGVKDNIYLDALQGVWAQNDEDNALFYIEGDSLYFVDNPEIGNGIKLNNDTLLIMGDTDAHWKILKLTNDSLWIIDEIWDVPAKLYKR